MLGCSRSLDCLLQCLLRNRPGTPEHTRSIMSIVLSLIFSNLLPYRIGLMIFVFDKESRLGCYLWECSCFSQYELVFSRIFDTVKTDDKQKTDYRQKDMNLSYKLHGWDKKTTCKVLYLAFLFQIKATSQSPFPWHIRNHLRLRGTEPVIIWMQTKPIPIWKL